MPPEVHSFPHLRDRASVPAMMWTTVLALLPSALTAIFLFGFDAFRTLAVAAASALLAEGAMRRLLARRSSLYDGSWVVTAILFALLLPPQLPFWMVALGSVAGTILGKEVFGGLGQNPFQPALVGIAFLAASFPFLHGVFSTAPGLGFQPALSASVFVGGIFALVKQLMNWEMPFFYLAAAVLISLALGEEAFPLPASFLLGAFFLVTDPVTGPLSRAARRWFALLAGAVTAPLALLTNPVEAVTYALLLANGLHPWLDRWCRPRRQ